MYNFKLKLIHIFQIYKKRTTKEIQQNQSNKVKENFQNNKHHGQRLL